MKLRHPIFALFLTVLFLFSAKGQTLDEAKQWYEQGKFSQAKPILEAEYASNPKNTAINLSLGVIALSESNLLKAQKHLESVARQKAPDASLYLGELYAKMYRFADAEKEFTKYERANRRKKDALAKLSDKRAEADKIRLASVCPMTYLSRKAEISEGCGSRLPSSWAASCAAPSSSSMISLHSSIHSSQI